MSSGSVRIRPPHFMLLAKAVRERETLYESEALFLLAAHDKPDAERGPMLKLLDKYRQERIAIAAPEKCFDGASDAQKAALFYEGPVEYSKRKTGQT